MVVTSVSVTSTKTSGRAKINAAPFFEAVGAISSTPTTTVSPSMETQHPKYSLFVAVSEFRNRAVKLNSFRFPTEEFR